MKKYKILWLDDAFEPNSTDSLNERYEKFYKTADIAKQFEVVKVVTADDFASRYEKSKFDAVILDVYGFKESDSIEKNSSNGFRKAINVVKSCLLKFVYTGETFDKEEDTQEFILGLSEDNNFIVKNKKKDTILSLFKEMLELLEDRASLVCPVIPKLLRNDFVAMGTKDYLEKVKQEYNEVMGRGKTPSQEGLSPIRPLIETLADELRKRGVVKVSQKDSNLGGWVNYIVNKTNVPPLIGTSLIYLLNLNNKIHHRDNTQEDIFNEYGLLMFNAIYYTLFVCLQWYYKTYLDNSERTDICKPKDGIVCYDEELKCYYVDNVILAQAKELSGMVGQKITLVSPHRNEAGYLRKIGKSDEEVAKLLNKYPFYAKFKK